MQTKNNLPLVVLFGRTNVGKSTLFNCLIEQNKAIISDIAGTTRDSNIGTVEWNGKKFKLVDTGGIMNIKNLSKKKVLTDDIDTKVQNQAREFLMRADLILFLVDTRTGLLPPDKEMALILKKIIPKNKTKVILIANKTDSPSLQKETAEFNKLGLGEPVNVSATTGSGTGDMLDIVIKKLQSAPWVKTKKTSSVLLRDSKPVKKNELKETSIEKEDCINVCILGKPNVGKSSLINAILGEERVIVSATPHTTREPQDTEIIYKNKKINLIDTAGISKQGQRGAKKIKFKKALEKQSIEKTLWILNRSNIALLVLDINEGLTHQDSKLVERIVKIDANPLNKFLAKIIKKHRPVKARGTKHPHIFELKQETVNPPKFSIRIGAKDTIHFSYLQFIKNRLREKFGFHGTPLTIYVDKNKRIHGKHEIINENTKIKDQN